MDYCNKYDEVIDDELMELCDEADKELGCSYCSYVDFVEMDDSEETE